LAAAVVIRVVHQAAQVVVVVLFIPLVSLGMLEEMREGLMLARVVLAPQHLERTVDLARQVVVVVAARLVTPQDSTGEADTPFMAAVAVGPLRKTLHPARVREVCPYLAAMAVLVHLTQTLQQRAHSPVVAAVEVKMETLALVVMVELLFRHGDKYGLRSYQK
jgi:hypothetical protein